MRRRRLVIVGLFGTGNLGDDLLLHNAVEILAELGVKREEIEVLSFGSRVNKVYQGIAHDISARSKWVVPFQIFRMLKSIIRADIVVYVPGGFLNDRQTRARLLWWMVPSILCVALRKKCVWVGLGVSHSFKDPLIRTVTRFVGKRLSCIVVRDNLSKERLVALGIPNSKVRVGADLAWLSVREVLHLSMQKLQGAKTKERPVVGISFINYPREYSIKEAQAEENFRKELAERVVSFIKQLREEGYDIVIINTTSCDYELGNQLSRTVYERYGITVLSRYTTVHQELFNEIASVDVIVAMRFHANIFSIMLGVPVVPVVYEDKVGELVRELGLDEYAVEYRDFEKGLKGGVPVEEIIAKVKYVSSLRPQICERLKEAAQLMYQRVRVNVEALKIYLQPEGENAGSY